MNNLDELFCRTVAVLFAVVRIDEMVPDVVFQHNCQKAVHRSATTCNSLQNVRTAVLFFKRPLNGFNLPLDTANPVEKLLLLLNRMTHCMLSPYPHRVYYDSQCTIGGGGIRE